MRKFLLPLVLSLGVMGGWQVFEAVQAGAQGTNVENFGFGQRIAGTWYYENVVFNGVPNEDKGVQTLSADGTWSGTETDDFGGDASAAFESPRHGSWRRTGPRESEAVSLDFAYDEGGELLWTVKLFLECQYSHDLNTTECSYVAEIFFPGEDPLGEGTPVGAGTFTGRRLQFD